jgi:hypothetical protein
VFNTFDKHGGQTRPNFRYKGERLLKLQINFIHLNHVLGRFGGLMVDRQVKLPGLAGFEKIQTNLQQIKCLVLLNLP